MTQPTSTWTVARAFSRVRRLRPAVVLASGLLVAGAGWPSVKSLPDTQHGAGGSPVSMMAKAGKCEPGFVEKVLNEWLVATEESEFESEYVTQAFDQLVELVFLLRDVAEDFCV